MEKTCCVLVIKVNMFNVVFINKDDRIGPKKNLVLGRAHFLISIGIAIEGKIITQIYKTEAEM